jgi:pyruvate,water dikinase
MSTSTFIRWFDTLGSADISLVGGKNAALGELRAHLTAAGAQVPNGFAVTADAYRALLADNGFAERLGALLEGLDCDETEDLARRAQRCRDLIYAAPLPEGLEAQIDAAFAALIAEYGADTTVAVRSSATAEDLPEASFAGQHDSYLNITGGRELVEACRRCFASLFTDRAIRYREIHGFDHLSVALSVGIMKMVRADIGSSGVVFSVDTETGFADVVFVTGAWGLGENVVQGTVDPDEFYVHKPTLALGHRQVLRRHLGDKKVKMVYGRRRGGTTTQNVPTAAEERRRYTLTDAEVVQLADLAVAIEGHFSKAAGKPQPMDIEWARDGVDGQLYILQARPETVASRQDGATLTRYMLTERSTPLVSGRAVGTKVVTGTVKLIHAPEDLYDFAAGQILVADTTTPDWGTVMRRAAGLVTNRGGRTCHAAIVARELDVPAVVGCGDATARLHDGDEITLSCCEGETGHVYAGELAFEVDHLDLRSLERPQTKIMLNLGNPDVAFRTALLPNDGVGLARLEFIITDYVGAHPMALAHPDRITNESTRAAISRLTENHESGEAFFIQRLSEGVATIGAAFYPKPVIVRLSDFKTNEYADLLGGRDFEPAEENPMIGFRGAARYAHPAYADGFTLECRALKRVREEMGLTNVKIMVPFCRRVDEAHRVLDMMASNGLVRGENGLEIYLMCEIPNNVVLIDEFSQLFDGISIGSNDLTQLTLGVDRDSEIVAFDFDERDPGVLKMLALAVEGAKRNGIHSGICGQAPSDYPEVAEYLVRLGIGSLSLNPDSVLPTMLKIAALEKANPR